ncbi:MAG: DUF2793 domain-containing protein [Holosporales bacterium]
MSTTPRLQFPYILSSQAQKEVTHADTLNRLDALVQAAIEDKDLTAPPGSPVEGALYIVAASPTGAWAGQGRALAQFLGGVWRFYAPYAGLSGWVKDENRPYVYNGTAWTVATTQAPQQLPSYTVAGLPAASGNTAGLIYISNESGGAVVAFSDGTNWRRVTDRAVVS